MKIECLSVGKLQANCYIVEDDGEAVVIDPGDESEKILAAVKKSGCALKKIVLTHGHFDHIGAVADIAEKTGAKVYVHSADAPMLSDNSINLGEMWGDEVRPCEADEFLDDCKGLFAGKKEIKVYHTPGHSNGGVCLLIENTLFAGDLLFKGSIGRFDRGDLKTELNSLKFLMDTFSDDIVVCPGHGEATTIGEERKFNPYIVNHVLG